MAYYGLSLPYIAKLNPETNTYSDGLKCGKAVGTDITPNYIEGSLYGDNELAEYIKEFNDADVSLTVTELPIKAENVMFGHTVDEAKGTVDYKSGDSPNYVGYGICVKEIANGIIKHVAAWLPKVKFGDPGESFVTKNGSISFVTPTITGKAAPDHTGEWRYKQTFETEEEADAWLREKAGMTAAE